jgi:hypothetical protein
MSLHGADRPSTTGSSGTSRSLVSRLQLTCGTSSVEPIQREVGTNCIEHGAEVGVLLSVKLAELAPVLVAIAAADAKAVGRIDLRT